MPLSENWRWPRVLVIVGLAGLVLGALDPLEGSVVIVAGSGIAMVGVLLARGRYWKLLGWSFILAAIGVAALFGVSALGGIGGNSGRSNWWWAAIAPYPVGWVLGLAGTIGTLRGWSKAT